VILLSGIAAALSVFLLSESDDEMPIGGTAGRPNASRLPASTISAESVMNFDAVSGRLVEVFEIQDRAFRERDDALLRSVFAADCPCLAAGQDRIRKLREDGLRWVGYRSRVSDVRAIRRDGRTWTLSAVVSATRTRVETESHEVLRLLPAGSLRWIFVLTQPPAGGPPLLSDAEVAG
jgi:hypothetical protein